MNKSRWKFFGFLGGYFVQFNLDICYLNIVLIPLSPQSELLIR